MEMVQLLSEIQVQFKACKIGSAESNRIEFDCRNSIGSSLSGGDTRLYKGAMERRGNWLILHKDKAISISAIKSVHCFSTAYEEKDKTPGRPKTIMTIPHLGVTIN